MIILLLGTSEVTPKPFQCEDWRAMLTIVVWKGTSSELTPKRNLINVNFARRALLKNLNLQGTLKLTTNILRRAFLTIVVLQVQNRNHSVYIARGVLLVTFNFKYISELDQSEWPINKSSNIISGLLLVAAIICACRLFWISGLISFCPVFITNSWYTIMRRVVNYHH